jgi:hypothetical protein
MTIEAVCQDAGAADVLPSCLVQQDGMRELDLLI